MNPSDRLQINIEYGDNKAKLSLEVIQALGRLQILRERLEDARRSSDLQHALVAVQRRNSQKVLSAELRELEPNGVVQRNVARRTRPGWMTP